MVKQKKQVDVEFNGKDLIAALEEAMEYVKEESRARKLASSKESVLTAKKRIAGSRLRVAAL